MISESLPASKVLPGRLSSGRLADYVRGWRTEREASVKILPADHLLIIDDQGAWKLPVLSFGVGPRRR